MEVKSETFGIASSAYKNTDTATHAIAEFVAKHEVTLKYLQKFGSPIEKAKANVMLKLADGVVL